MFNHDRACNFIRGTATDHKGRTVRDYMFFSPTDWEVNHDIVQWAFPTNVVSAYNDQCPVVLPGKMAAEKDLEYLQAVHMVLVVSYLNTLGIFLSNNEAGMEFKEPNGIPPLGHQQLRITRIIISLRLFGHDKMAAQLGTFMLQLARKFPTAINTTTVGYWYHAMHDPLH